MATLPVNNKQADILLNKLKHLGRFWSAWFRSPGSVGAVAPSSPSLAKAMVHALGDIPDGDILELGPGTGAITHYILQLTGRHVIALEKDHKMAAKLQQLLPKLEVLQGDAQYIPELLSGRQLAAVVSGLPLLNMPHEIRENIIAGAFEAMHADGVMVQFTYGPNQPIPVDLTDALGIKGKRGKKIWNNVPPATVWRFTKPLSEPKQMEQSDQPVDQPPA